MRDNYILTAESVTEGHPDKLCDTIADAVLDACLLGDPDSRVACEVLATAGKIAVAGEITTNSMPDIPHIVCNTVRQIGYSGNYEVEVDIHDQSPDIAEAVNGESEVTAGDQGIVYGYACRETPQLLPLPVVLAHRITMGLTEARRNHLLEWLRPDGKAQVSVEYEDGKPMRVRTVVVSAQHEPEVSQKELREAVYQLILVPALGEYLDQNTEILINPSGSFVLGGFEADTGLTGRKLMVDTYGGIVSHGGGALSGKDCTKVDRSGAYMARYLAKNIVAAGMAKRCEVQIAYAIGKSEPVSVTVDTFGTGVVSDSRIEAAVKAVFDLTPAGIIRDLKLNRPIYSRLARYGHFGRTELELSWEEINRKYELLSAALKQSARQER